MKLRPPELSPANTQRSEDIAMANRTEGIDGKVGWGRFTVFYIPLVPIYITGDDNTEVANLVAHALQHVGYRVERVERGSVGRPLVLEGTVEKFWFNNYTWLFPFGPTWGSIDLRLDLVDESRASVWHRTFRGSGRSFNFFNGFTSAANEAMKKILEDMVAEFAYEDFHRLVAEAAVEGSPPDASN